MEPLDTSVTAEEDHLESSSLGFSRNPATSYGSVNDSHSQSGMTGPEILNLGYYDVLKGYVRLSAVEQIKSPDTWRSLVTEFLGSLAAALFFALTVYTLGDDVTHDAWTTVVRN